MSPLFIEDLPIFPLKTVLFPGGVLPLRVFETRYVDMTRECMKENRPFGVCLIRAGGEVGEPAVPEETGTLATVTDFDVADPGVLGIRARGGKRFRIVSRTVSRQGLVRAKVEVLEPEPDAPVPSEFAGCARIVTLVIADQAAGTFAEPYEFESASWVGYRLSEILPVPLKAKQKLLELEGGLERLEVLQKFLEQRGLASGN
ncbi:MAG: LON peptidase substrate-binding domain-containing protein [Burkholderiales bacterium]|nr:LON peptidase substrate-binding domain-containing protein [Burkholderiales bacterium]